MFEFKTCCAIRLTRLQSLLADADIPFVVFDQHISALEAGIGRFRAASWPTQSYLFSARAQSLGCGRPAL